MEVTNRQDEWRIEQGLTAAKLPILDQSRAEARPVPPEGPFKEFKDEAAIWAIGDPNKLFAEELEGWKG